MDEQKFLNEKKKLFYLNMIRTQLSNPELWFLLFTCLSKRGSRKFSPLIEKYKILNHLKRYDDELRGLNLDLKRLVDFGEAGRFWRGVINYS